MAPVGYFAVADAARPRERRADGARREALPFLRIMFMFSSGHARVLHAGGALRSAGDARTPMILGVAMTVLNIVLQRRADPRARADSGVRHAGAAMGTCSRPASSRSTRCGSSGAADGWCRSRASRIGPDWTIIRSLFQFGLPTGIQGIAMNIGGVLMLVVHRLARAERGGAGGVRRVVLAALLAHHVDVGRAHGRGGGGRRPEPRRRTSRIAPSEAVHVAARHRRSAARRSSACSSSSSRASCSRCSAMNEPEVVDDRHAAAARARACRDCSSPWRSRYTGGLQGTGDTKSPLYISIVSQVLVPLGICFVIQRSGTLQPMHIWIAILVGHATRCALSVLRFNQGKWRRSRSTSRRRRDEGDLTSPRATEGLTGRPSPPILPEYLRGGADG